MSATNQCRGAMRIVLALVAAVVIGSVQPAVAASVGGGGGGGQGGGASVGGGGGGQGGGSAGGPAVGGGGGAGGGGLGGFAGSAGPNASGPSIGARRGGDIFIPGGGRRHGPNGFTPYQRHFREYGSGFGYNGGYYGQDAYLPYRSSRCLVRVKGRHGPRIARVC